MREVFLTFFFIDYLYRALDIFSRHKYFQKLSIGVYKNEPLSNKMLINKLLVS